MATKSMRKKRRAPIVEPQQQLIQTEDEKARKEKRKTRIHAKGTNSMTMMMIARLRG
jgi:hypothetical protein